MITPDPGTAEWIAMVPNRGEVAVLHAMLDLGDAPATQEISQALPITLDDTLWHLRALSLKDLVVDIDPTARGGARCWMLTAQGRAWAKAWKP